jgi:hypothetical protein
MDGRGIGREGKGMMGRRRGRRDIPHNQSSPLFWKLINILFSNRITPIQPPLEQVGEFVKFTEFPLCVGCVLAGS